MDEIDYKAVSANLATQLAEQIYQTAQWKNLAETVTTDRDALRVEKAQRDAPETGDEG